MRENLRHLKWIIWVVIGAFVILIFAVWGGAGQGSKLSGAEWVATVGGEPIKMAEFAGSYKITELNYRDIYRRQRFVPKEMNLGYMVLQEMVHERLLGLGARELGLQVTNEELAEHIRQDPDFQEGEKFIGRKAYLDRLTRFGISPGAWEAQQRWYLLSKKYREFLMAGIGVSDREVEDRFHDMYRRINLRYILVPPEKLPKDAPVGDADARAYYEVHRDLYKVPEERKIEYAVVDTGAVAAGVHATEEDLKNYYERAKEFYFVSKDTWRASHVLISAGESATAAEREAAEIKAGDVARRAKAGENFAALARQFSQDPGSAAKGGDLGNFGPGVMVPEFEVALRSLKPGEISDPVRTQFGWHVIRLDAYDPGGYYREFKDVRAEMERDYRRQEGGRLAYDIAMELSQATAANFAQKAAEKGLKLQTSPFFARTDAVFTGEMERVGTQTYFLGLHDISQPIAVGKNYAVVHLVERRENRLRALDEVLPAVRKAVQDERRKSAWEKWAAPHLAQLRGGLSLDDLSRKLGASVPQITGDYTRRNKPVQFTQETPGLFEATDGMKAGEFGAYYLPATGEKRGLMIFVVDAKIDFEENALDKEKALIRSEIARTRFQEFLPAVVARLQERYPVQIKDEVVEAMQGGKGSAPPPL
jgi:peptidyl-prolyl cis-trans isomerase D